MTKILLIPPHSSPIRALAMGDKVMMRAKGKWEPAIVTAISQVEPHSYITNTTIR